MRSLLLTVGKPRQKYTELGLAEYVKRLKAYGGCTLDWVKAEKARKGIAPQALKKAEGERLLSRLGARDHVWALDPGGAAWSSEKWAARLEKAQNLGASRLSLVIGGAWGLSPELLKRADAKISLGPVVIAHELAALVTLEQLYRAHTIIAKTPYHRA